MAIRKPSQKIWYHNGTAYKSEQMFLDNCKDKSNVAIYEMVEYHHDAKEYKNQLLKQRERDEQLSIVLDETSDSAKISRFRNKLIELRPEDYYTKKIIKSLNKDGLNLRAFRIIAGNYKEFLLHKVSNDVEWFEILLDIYSFRMEKVHGGYQKIETDQTTIDNFNKAKENLKKRKK